MIVKMILRQLEAIQAMLDTLVSELKEFEQAGEAAQKCEHPIEHRLDLSTMGHIRWKCKLCGYVHEEDVKGDI